MSRSDGGGFAKAGRLLRFCLYEVFFCVYTSGIVPVTYFFKFSVYKLTFFYFLISVTPKNCCRSQEQENQTLLPAMYFSRNMKSLTTEKNGFLAIWVQQAVVRKM